MKEIPKKDRPDVSGGAQPGFPPAPCFPDGWPRYPEDGPTIPDVYESPCQSPPPTPTA